VRAQLQSKLLPCGEVVRRGDSAAGAVSLADRPELVESSSALDGGLIDTLGLVDVVGSSVGGDRSLQRRAATRVVAAVGLDDVVLDEGARGPAVNGEVAVTTWCEICGKGDILCRSRVPSLSCDKVSLVTCPGNGICTRISISVRDVAGTVRPEGVVEAAVGTGGGRATCTSKKLSGI